MPVLGILVQRGGRIPVLAAGHDLLAAANDLGNWPCQVPGRPMTMGFHALLFLYDFMILCISIYCGYGNGVIWMTREVHRASC